MEDMDIDDYSRDRSRSPVRDRGGYESRNSRDDYRGSNSSSRGAPRDRNYKRSSNRSRGDDFGDSSSKSDRNYENLIFVRNVPFTSTSRDIESLFREVGDVVRADIVTRRGQSRGMATVEFRNKQDAQRAIEKLDNHEYEGRELKLRQDYPPPEKNGGNSSSRSRDDDYYRDDRGSNRRNDYREDRDYRRDRGDRNDRDRNDRDRNDRDRNDRDRGDSDLFRGRGERKERGAPTFADRPGIEIFVGNLPFSVTWQSLKDLMRKAGEVIRADVRTDSWGKLRGFGTVIFETDEDAHRAIDLYSGYSLDGRQLDVRLGRNRESRRENNDRDSRRSGDDRSGENDRRDRGEFRQPREVKQNTPFTEGVTGNGAKSSTIYVDNLPWVTNEDDLFELFETIGRVTKAEVQYEDRGRPSGAAVVEFELEELAELAIQNLNGYNYGGRDLRISFARKQNDEPAGASAPAPIVADNETDLPDAIQEDTPLEDSVDAVPAQEPEQIVQQVQETNEIPVDASSSEVPT